jgi:phosphocarrier protein HPr
MKETTLTVINETGLHSRPADLFVRTAKLYEANVTVHKGEKSADAKNIIKVVLLNVSQNEKIRIEAEGKDEEEVMQALTELIESNFEHIDDRVKV